MSHMRKLTLYSIISAYREKTHELTIRNVIHVPQKSLDGTGNIERQVLRTMLCVSYHNSRNSLPILYLSLKILFLSLYRFLMLQIHFRRFIRFLVTRCE